MSELNLEFLDHPELAEMDVVLDDLSEQSAGIELPFRFKPRAYQEPLWYAIFRDEKKRYALEWHRRAGKDRNLFNAMVMDVHRDPCNALYVLPTYTQARKVIWDGIGADGMRYIDHVPPEIAKPNHTEMKFTFATGGVMQIVGADKPAGFRGTNPRKVVFSEWQRMNPSIWTSIFQPVLAENGGWAAFAWTPEGKNHAYQMRQAAMADPQRWYFSSLNVTQTQREDGSPVVTPEDIEHAKAEGMSDDEVQREFFLSYEAAIPGAYYGKEFALLRQQGRIGYVPPDPNLPLVDIWDLGVGDAMAIWVGQFRGAECRFVYYHEDNGYGVEHYINHLKAWGEARSLRWERHIGPHDIRNRMMWDANAVATKAAQADWPFEVAPGVGLQDGINAVRKMLPHCWFDEEGCAAGLSALQSYTKKWDDVGKTWLDKPRHDWASHGADAFRIFAVSYRDHWKAPRRTFQRYAQTEPQGPPTGMGGHFPGGFQDAPPAPASFNWQRKAK